MSCRKVAAAQYEPRKASLTEQVAHHLEFVRAAARQQCELLVFPSLSLLGCDYKRRPLPAPPDLSLLDPLCYAAMTYRMTIITGLPVEYNDRFIRGIAVFAPWMNAPAIYHQSHGACLGRHSKTITVVDGQPEGIDMDPSCSLFTTGQCISEPDLLTSTRHLQFFSHQYSIAVLMANARGNSALWDEYGRLIVRADYGSLLLVGQRTSQGWQGDIIPLR
ncbi:MULTISPECIES: carbon-nitrogen hydrolase family protein YobB [unclassified Escherichia]|uniref:carbon-nitrogen hydrolase family protein YobB n=1 Tax=unclassified Escherichia TaxID=2608889 RepID=UPI000CF5E354|nr:MULTISPECIES: carbon-nitrogen hydrolase family protein YobB [unclassified Escherichia]